MSNLGIGRFLACSYDFIRIQTHFRDFNGKHEHEIVTIRLLRSRILKNPNVYSKASKEAGLERSDSVKGHSKGKVVCPGTYIMDQRFELPE